MGLAIIAMDSLVIILINVVGPAVTTTNAHFQLMDALPVQMEFAEKWTPTKTIVDNLALAIPSVRRGHVTNVISAMVWDTEVAVTIQEQTIETIVVLVVHQTRSVGKAHVLCATSLGVMVVAN